MQDETNKCVLRSRELIVLAVPNNFKKEIIQNRRTTALRKTKIVLDMLQMDGGFDKWTKGFEHQNKTKSIYNSSLKIGH